MRTSLKKIVALSAAVGLVTMNVASAAVIGTGSVTGSGAYDASINWDDAFPGTASGSVTGIAVSATVAPILSMQISTGALNLGTLSATTATASLNIEVGTNANAGLILTAQSTNGGLESTTASGQINSLNADGIAESYKFVSVLGAIDSPVAGFVAGGALDTEVIDSTAHVIYSTNKPENLNGTNEDVAFNVTSSIAYTTPAAADYSDTITFTVTGTF